MNDTITIALIAFVSSMFTALFGMLFKLCYASKCRSTSICWNCLKIERDVGQEQSIRNLELNNSALPHVLRSGKDQIDL
jgi:hypothetical protein